MMRGRDHKRELKLEVCRQIVNGEKLPAQICREHELANSLLLRWRKDYEQNGDGAFLPGLKTAQEATERRVAKLERFCDQLTVENAVLKKALEMVRSRSDTQ